MKAIADAALATMQTAWNSTQVHAAGAVPGDPTTPYIVMYGPAERDDVMMLDGTAAVDGNRLMPMAVGKTESEVNRAVDRIRGAFRGKRLAVAGYDTTPAVIESTGGVVRDPDGGGLLSVTVFITFTATETEPS